MTSFHQARQRATNRWDAIRLAQAWLAERPVFLDTETTGLDDYAEIVEIAIVDADGRTLLNTLVRPQGQVPWEAVRVHGLTNERLQHAPSWPQVWPQVQQALQGRLVAIYNAEYDVRLLQQTNARYRLPFDLPDTRFVCIMELYAAYRGVRQGDAFRRWSLEQAGQALGIPLPNSHRALDDTLLAKAVLERIAAEKLPW